MYVIKTIVAIAIDIFPHNGAPSSWCILASLSCRMASRTSDGKPWVPAVSPWRAASGDWLIGGVVEWQVF